MTIQMNRNRGFSLIELMIVIAIIGILVAVALPQFASMTEDAKKTKAKQDCDTIAQAIQKYNSLEGSQVEQLMDLKGKYLTNIDTLKDPWRNLYQVDTFGGTVFSKGPDGQANIGVAGDKKNADNIKISYIGALTIVKATIEINPLGEADPSLAFDVLHLYFNKRVVLPTGTFPAGVPTIPFPVNVWALTTPTAPTLNVTQGKSADPQSPAFAFRWCEGSKNKYVGTASVFKKFNISGAEIVAAAADYTCALPLPANRLYTGIPAAKYVYWSDDSREIIIAFGQGTSGSIIPGTHFINLTGNAKNNAAIPSTRNPVFREFNGTIGGEMSGTATKIEVYD